MGNEGVYPETNINNPGLLIAGCVSTQSKLKRKTIDVYNTKERF